MQNLSTKSGFAKQLGVNESTVTRFIQRCPEVLVRNKINLNHKKVIAYIEKRNRNRSHQVRVTDAGTPLFIDSLYDAVAIFCREQVHWSTRKIRDHFKITNDRAKRLNKMLSDAGIKSVAKPVVKAIPKPVVESLEPEPIEVSGVEAAPKVKPKPRAPVKPKPVKITNHEPMDKPAPIDPAQHGLDELPDDIRELQNWTLIKIITRFGTSCGLESYLKSVKMMEEITERRIKNYKANGELVTRDIVARQIIEPLDICFARMLRDGSRSITSILTNMIKAGDSFEECEVEVKKQLSTFIKPVKKSLRRGLS